jgi:glycosyltransferase involved in cell wall biosynthesis/SAM-dependent methyltransferase
LIATFNEADVIECVSEHLIENGIELYVIDNHSTDGTPEILRKYEGRGLVGIETYPAGAAEGTVSWQEILDRKLAVAQELQADWYIHHDADEIRWGPWAGLSLCESFGRVDRAGFNAVDFRLLNFPPVDNCFEAGGDLRSYFDQCEDAPDYDRVQVKAWKAGPRRRLELGGHEIQFADRKIFPVRFLLCHYPIRSQQHGERKVFSERKDRFTASERAMGWHRQYDDVGGPGYCFLRNPACLNTFTLADIQADLQVEHEGKNYRAVHSDDRQNEFEGYLDGVRDHTIFGWARRTNGAEQTVDVDIWAGSERIGTIRADVWRKDLEDAGIGDGRFGFRFRTPRALVGSTCRAVWATISGTDVSLKGCPQFYIETNRARSPEEVNDSVPVSAPRRTDSPSVSVIIPCFNLGTYLDEAVQSVLDQTYQDFEIVIVDDGSDDPATRHMLASYRRPLTRIVRTENRGLASARNTGLEASSGRFVSFLDADDILEPAFLELAVAALERDPECAFASCWLRAFGLAEFDWTPSTCEFPELLVEDTVCTAAVTRRETMIDVGGFDPEMPLAGYEDWDAAISLVEKGHHGVIIPDFLFRYRIRSGSMTSVCTQPKNHSRLFEYLLSKHRSSFEGHSQAVIALLEERIGALQQSLAAGPPRPSIATHASALDVILTLEDHRKTLEDLSNRPILAPDDKSANLDWGSLRKTEPVSRAWGLDRGTPVDRYYIAQFLDNHAAAITGSVLEVKDRGYTNVHGRDVTATEVVDIAPDNSEATLIADLSILGSLPAEKFDCFVLTQTIHVIYDSESVVRSAYETLRPGGAVLATLPCVSRVDYESGLGGDFWRFTAASASRLFGEAFGSENVEVAAFGNVLACTAFLQGIAAEELTREELDDHDPYFPLIVGVMAKKEVRPTKQRGNIEGHLDAATCWRIAGWALDPSDIESPLEVEVLIGGRGRGSVVADGYRHDLELAGKGQGRCAFEWAAHDLHESIGQLVTLRVNGSDTGITGERTLECVCERSRVGAEGISAERDAGSAQGHGRGSGAVLVYHSVGGADGDDGSRIRPDQLEARLTLSVGRS